jgi:hypothetical protein
MTQPLSFTLGNLTNRSSSFTLSSAEGALRIFIVVARFEIATRRHPVSDKMTHIGWFDLMGDFCNLLIIAPYICLDSCYSWNMLKLPSKFTQFLLVLRGEVGYRKLGMVSYTKNLRLSTRIGKPSVVYPYLAGVYLSGIANTASHIWEYFGIYCIRAIHTIDAIHQTPKIILKNKLPSNHTSDGGKILHQLVDGVSRYYTHYLQCFVVSNSYPAWCRI